MREKRVMSRLLIICIVFVMAFTGCTKETGTNTIDETKGNNVDTSKETVEEEIKQKRPYKFLLMESIQLPATPYMEQTIPKEIIQRTGIKFEAEYVGKQDYDTKLNLYMASGTPPDVFCSNDIALWKEQGAIIPIGDLIDTYGDEIKKYVSPEAWQYAKYDGDIYGIPDGERPEAFNSKDRFGLQVRMDWIRKLGFEDKVLSENFDLEQYHDLLKAITFNDPDGDGEKNTYGMGETSSAEFNIIFGAYGLADWVKRGDEIVPKHMTDEYKEAVKLLRAWYAEGLIDPEFVVTKGNQMKEKLVNSVVGTLGANVWATNPANATHAALVKNVPDAELTMVIPPKGPKGHRGWPKQQPGSAAQGYRLITSTAPNPELLIKLINYVMSEEGAMLGHYGFEGKDYTYDREANRIQMITDQGQIPTLYGQARLVPITDRRWAPEKILQGLETTKKYTVPNEFYGQVPSMAQYADLDKIVSETLVKVIMGEADLSRIDDMQKRWIENGGQKIIDEVNEEWRKMK